jgi:hypothetical protein
VDKLDQLSEQVGDVGSNLTKVGRNVAKFKDEWEAFTNCNVILSSPTKLNADTQLKDQESQLCVEWISTMNFYSRQADMLNRRQEGTGEWLFQSDEFKTWLTGAEKTLWCSGLRKFPSSRVH